MKDLCAAMKFSVSVMLLVKKDSTINAEKKLLKKVLPLLLFRFGSLSPVFILFQRNKKRQTDIKSAAASGKSTLNARSVVVS